METIPKLSESEWTVMKVIWEDNPISASAIIVALAGVTTWKPKTIKSLLNRMVKKKAITYEIRGREYHYSPAVEEAAVIQEESRSFLNRMFGGAVEPMLAALAESNDLTLKDIENLKRIVEKKQRS
jgi:BlaI family penicillinase repressor